MRKVLVSSSIVAVLLLLSSATVFAQGKGKNQGNAGSAAKVKVYDFSGDTIEGDLIKPEGTGVDVRDFGAFSSLIRIRKDFIAEIIKAAEDL